MPLYPLPPVSAPTKVRLTFVLSMPLLLGVTEAVGIVLSPLTVSGNSNQSDGAFTVETPKTNPVIIFAI
jgi:P pilus assembly chaperone PapD